MGISLPKKLSKTNLAIIFFTLTLILSIVGLFALRTEIRTTYSVVANRLNYEPERYVLLENPDNYTLQAISNGHSVIFYSPTETNIDELVKANTARFDYKDFYFKYNNSFYAIGLITGDGRVEYPVLCQISIAFSSIALVVLSIRVIAQIDNRRKKVN